VTTRVNTTNDWGPFVASLSRDDLEGLYGACIHRLADLPFKYPHVYTGNESWGGDPRLAKGGKLRPNPKAGKR
jgi:hypothetical protein